MLNLERAPGSRSPRCSARAARSRGRAAVAEAIRLYEAKGNVAAAAPCGRRRGSAGGRSLSAARIRAGSRRPGDGVAGRVHRRRVAGDPQRADHRVAVDLDAAGVVGHAHRPDDRVRRRSPSPPTSTGPVLPLIVSGPVIVAPQIRTDGRAVRDDRPGDPAALDVERPARRDRHRPGLAPAGADADRLTRRDVQRPRARPGQARTRVARPSACPATNVSNTYPGALSEPAVHVIG